MESRLSRLEAVQVMVLEIGQISNHCNNINEFLHAVHQALSRIMYAANFYVALYKAEQNSIQFAYHVDEFDPSPDPAIPVVLESPEASPTAWVIYHRQPLIMTAEEDAAQEAAGNPWGSGARAEHWMGYPLLDHEKKSLGALVIQSYDAEHTFSQEDQALFGLIANHVSNALQGFQSVDRLERAVQERTALLAHEVTERRRTETLQRALYQIAELSFSAADPNSLYAELHQIIGQLLVARNFMIALYHQDTEEISIQYFVDEKDEHPSMKRFPLGVGMTSFVIHCEHAQLIDKARLAELVAGGQIRQALGNMELYSWMGAPILANDHVHGVIVVQSYDPHILYNETDLELLAFVASHVAVAVTRLEADREMRNAKARLEEQNTTLNQALLALQEAQSELVRQEKLASLGRLVAGVAHEINTPLGICVTATSHLVDELKLTRKDMAADTMTQESLEEFLDIVDQSLRILTSNTRRAATLVRSFKQVAVDQTSNDKRLFQLKTYLDEVLLSLQPKLKGRPIRVEINCPEEIRLDSYPGAVSQVVTNLLMNSIHHAFENNAEGQIWMTAEADGANLKFDYSDNGIGVDQDGLDKLFDPFYTTKRGQGGSGLGTHIIYNLITGVLGGTVKASSQPGSGLSYQIRFPMVAKNSVKPA